MTPGKGRASTPTSRTLDAMIRADHALGEKILTARGQAYRADTTGRRIDAAAFRRIADAYEEAVRALREVRSVYLDEVHGVVGDPERAADRPPAVPPAERPSILRDPLHKDPGGGA